jgi:hypothetical protein
MLAWVGLAIRQGSRPCARRQADRIGDMKRKLDAAVAITTALAVGTVALHTEIESCNDRCAMSPAPSDITDAPESGTVDSPLSRPLSGLATGATGATGAGPFAAGAFHFGGTSAFSPMSQPQVDRVLLGEGR